jgi:hypothetical protein
MLTSIAITFTGVVTLPANVANAFEMRREDNNLVSLAVDLSRSTSTQTIVVLTFSGSNLIAGSLSDGRYTLRIKADQVQDDFGRRLDGDGDGVEGGDRMEAFFRLFGDSDGDGDVDTMDYGRFRTSFMKREFDPAFLWYFDYDGDGDVDDRDFNQFRSRLGKRI